jgi:hypothetical protein
MAQDFYLVIGQGTDVGKTTLATALLRVLNRHRHPAIGFKPYSAILLTPLANAIWEDKPARKGNIIGNDSVNLANASPLTGLEDVECIVPVQYVCHPNYHSAIFARTGSRIIGDRRLLRSDHQGAFLDRPDLAALLDRNGIALDEMARAKHLKLSSCPGHSHDQVDASYRQLASRDPTAAVVCEGIGPFLPLWRGIPVIDHLFFIGMSAVRFFPNIRLSLDGGRHDNLQNGKMIDHLLGRGGGLSAVLPLAPDDERAHVTETVVEGLLQEAKAVR